MSLREPFGRSGGLSYHLLALRSRQRWAPFAREVASFLLETWNPQERELIVFGPSGAWTLPATFISRFSRLIVVEPDPIARRILHAKWGHKKSSFISDRRVLPWFEKAEERGTHLERLLKEHPKACILFANVLGQIPLLTPKNFSSEDHERAQNAILTALRGRNWASYHDVLSAQEVAKDGALASLWLEDDLGQWAEAIFPAGTQIIDHETAWLGRPSKLALWRLRKKSTHLIGFVAPNSPANNFPRK